MAEKIDIFQVLDHCSKKNISFYENLPDDKKKAIAPFVIQRWLTGTSNGQQIFLINEIVNPFVFTLQKHKTLLWYLITCCMPGKTQRYFWNKTKTSTTKPETLTVVCEYFNYSKKHGRDAINVLKHSDIISCAESLGKQQDIISKINKEWGVKNAGSNKSKTLDDDSRADAGGSAGFEDIFEE